MPARRPHRGVLRRVRLFAPLAPLALGASAASAPPPRQQGRQHAKPEAISLLGRPLYAQPDTAGAIAKADSALARNPRNIDTLIAAGVAHAASWHYKDAIALYTKGLTMAPNDARLYRHRGHRAISLRRFDDAVRDLELGWKLDSMSYDIAYHLGLAYYMKGDFRRAAAVYDRCTGYATNPAALAMDTAARRGFKSCTTIATNNDDKVGMAEWRYRSLLRAGRTADAARLLDEIGDSMRVRESGAYYLDLLVSKGRRSEQAVLDSLKGNELQWTTAAYGLAVRRLVNGDAAGARSLFEQIVRDVNYWPAFGYIGSEVELSRIRRAKGKR